jgi:hypothetical protein
MKNISRKNRMKIDRKLLLETILETSFNRLSNKELKDYYIDSERQYFNGLEDDELCEYAVKNDITLPQSITVSKKELMELLYKVNEVTNYITADGYGPQGKIINAIEKYIDGCE